ncbi:MAG: YncE family protein [Polyangiales bacterium]
MKAITRAVAMFIPLSLASCAGDDSLQCGAGTTLADDVCVPVQLPTDDADTSLPLDTSSPPDAVSEADSIGMDSSTVPETNDTGAIDDGDAFDAADTTDTETEEAAVDSTIDSAAIDVADAAIDVADAADATDEGSGPITCSGSASLSSSGSRAIAAAEDFVPLCGTRVAISDRSAKQIAVIDLATGVVEHTHPLEAAPGSLALDESRSLLYASLFPEAKLARINLVTGAVLTIPLTAPPFTVTMGSSGMVLASALGPSGEKKSTLLVIDGVAGRQWATSTTLPNFAGPIAHSAGLIYLGEGGYSDSVLMRYKLDLSTPSLTLEEQIETGPVLELALSPDGHRIAASNAGSVLDRDASAFTVIAGEWRAGSVAPAFSSDGALFGAGDDVALQLFDVFTHVRLANVSLLKCSGRYRHGRFARTGKVLLALAECYSGPSEIDWLTAP